MTDLPPGATRFRRFVSLTAFAARPARAVASLAVRVASAARAAIPCSNAGPCARIWPYPSVIRNAGARKPLLRCTALAASSSAAAARCSAFAARSSAFAARCSAAAARRSAAAARSSSRRAHDSSRVLDTVPATDWTPDAHYVSPIMRERAYAPSSIESAPRSESVSKSESEPVGSQSSTSSPAPQRKPSTSTSVAPSATSTARS